MRWLLYTLFSLFVAFGICLPLLRQPPRQEDAVETSHCGEQEIASPAQAEPNSQAKKESGASEKRQSKPVPETALPTVQEAARAMKELSNSVSMAKFVSEEENLFDRILETMDECCQGNRPTGPLHMFRPEQPFQATDSPHNAREYVISPIAINRFQPLLQDLLAISPETLAQCYQLLKPSLQKAYVQGKYNYGSLNALVETFLDKIQTMPDYNFNPGLVSAGNGRYIYQDSLFESMDDFQKLLLRLGHDNLMKLKSYARQVRSALNQH